MLFRGIFQLKEFLMLVECEKCRSIYDLDDRLLKLEGTRVRCSVCRHVFKIFPEIPKQPEKPEDSSVTGTAQAPDLGNFLKEMDVHPEHVSKSKISGSNGVEEKGVSGEKRELTYPTPDRGIAVSPGEKISSKFQEKPRRSAIRAIILLLLLFLTGAAGSVIYFAPELIPWKIPFLVTPIEQSKDDQGIKWLGLSGVKGTFLESQKLGKIFVVRGTVKNNDKIPRSFILLKVSVLDEKGKVIRSLRTYAGNSFEDQELTAMEMQAIQSALSNRSGVNNANIKVAPGSSLPFMAVFDRLPENLSEFTVEPVSSFGAVN
jgi:predicted Zn finger-like uncharacterized protein